MTIDDLIAYAKEFRKDLEAEAAELIVETERDAGDYWTTRFIAYLEKEHGRDEEAD